MPRHLEENMQMSCHRWFCYQYPNLALLLHHSPNGGKRNAREAARFKAMGTKAGFPDLFLYYPSKGFHGLALEMKTGTGKQTDNQKLWERKLIENGYSYRLVRSIEEFIEHVRAYIE